MTYQVLDENGLRDATPDEATAIEALQQPNISALQAAMNEQINQWRAAANLSTFPYNGKEIACDSLSRSDLDGVANNIALTGSLPSGFPGVWKATDNTLITIASADDFKALYAAMTAQGSANFNHAQSLKQQVASATTADQIAAIVW